MGNKISELIAKLTLLGNTVKLVEENSLIVTNNSTAKKTLIVRDDNKNIVSDEYDDIEHLTGTDYNLVRINNKYGIVTSTQNIKEVSNYAKLDRYALASNGVYNIVAKLDNGLYGVIDTEDREIIPFYHSKIDVYKIGNLIVYIGDSVDCKRVYKDNGKLYGVSNIIDVRDIIVCRNFIIVYNVRDKRHSTNYSIYDLDGNMITEADNSELVNRGEYYQIINNKGDVIIDNIQEADKIVHN